MRLLDFYFGIRETYALVTVLVASLALAFVFWIKRKKDTSETTKSFRKGKLPKKTMPKKNSKQKKQAQKQAERKKANKAKAEAAAAAVPRVVREQNAVEHAKPEPDKVMENGSDNDSDSEDDDSDDDLEYMERFLGIKIKKDDKKDAKVAAPRLATLLEQAEKEPEKIQQIGLPLRALELIVNFCNGPSTTEILKTQSLFEFSLAAAESWETAGLKNARSKLNQKAQRALRKKEMEERGEDLDASSSATNDLETSFTDDDEYYDDDGDFLDDYYNAKGAGKQRYNVGGKSNTFKAVKSRAHSTMKRASQRAL